MMGCGWWNPPTAYKEDCYWYREEQDMNAHIPYCLYNNKFPLDSCDNCEDYHSRNKRTIGDKIRGMNDRQLTELLEGEYSGIAKGKTLDWLRKEVKD